MPRARPDTTTSPAAPRSRASSVGEFAPQRRGVARAHDGDHVAFAADAAWPSTADQRRRRHPAPPGLAEIPASQDAISRPPSFASASSSRAASSSRRQHEVLAAAARAPGAAIPPARPRPSRSARSGCAKVTGPTFSVRASRSQARRSLSSSVRAIGSSLAPMRGSCAAQQPADIFAMHEEDQQRPAAAPAAA